MSEIREKRMAFLLATSPHLKLAGDSTYEEAAKDLALNGVTITSEKVEKTKKEPTVADIIRSYSDDELAEWLILFIKQQFIGNLTREVEFAPDYGANVLEWLQTPILEWVKQQKEIEKEGKQ